MPIKEPVERFDTRRHIDLSVHRFCKKIFSMQKVWIKGELSALTWLLVDQVAEFLAMADIEIETEVVQSGNRIVVKALTKV